MGCVSLGLTFPKYKKMSGKKLKYVLMAVVALLVVWFVKDAFTQPGVQDLPGGFEEVAFYRNENNTGPIVRIYAVTLEEASVDQMRQYGDFMPHTKYGTTKVYFFKKGQPAPAEVSPEGENIAEEFQQSCLAKYEKDAMGQVSLVEQPFK